MNTCQRCIITDGGCCTDIQLTIHKDEMSHFMEKKITGQLPEGHSFEQDEVYHDLYEYQSGGEACMFLEKTGNCTIYENRPTICRTYPAMWHRRLFKMQWFVDRSCPLTEEVPLGVFNSWINQIPNPHLVHEIGDLDFNIRDTDYIILNVKTINHSDNIFTTKSAIIQ